MRPIYLYRSAVLKDGDTIPPQRVDRYPDFPRPYKTVAMHTNGFTGTVTVEASLALSPTDNDWFPIWIEDFAPRAADEQSQRNRTQSIEGNFIWMRVTVEGPLAIDNVTRLPIVGAVDRVTVL